MKAQELQRDLLATIDPENPSSLSLEELFQDGSLADFEILEVHRDGTVIFGVDKQDRDADGLMYNSELYEMKISVEVRELNPEMLFPRTKARGIAGFADYGSMNVAVPE